MKTVFALCALGPFLLAGTVSAGPAVAVRLLETATVSGPVITLGDVAQVTGADAALAARLRSVNMGQAPWPGQSIVLDPGMVRLRIKAARLDDSQVGIVDAGRVRVTRSFTPVTGDELIKAATDSLTAAFTGQERLECVVTQQIPEVRVSSGQVQLAAKPPAQVRAGVVTVPVDVLVDGRRERSVSVPVRVKLNQLVVVTAQAIARGQTLTEADVRTEEKDLGAMAGSVLTDPAAAVGLRASRSMASGTVLKSSDLEVVPLVHKNGPVVIRAVTGRVTVSGSGVALESGQMGQLVKVRPARAKDSVSGKVAGEGIVEVTL